MKGERWQKTIDETEIPTKHHAEFNGGGTGSFLDGGRPTVGRLSKQPETAIEALMVTAPGEEPEESIEEAEPRRIALVAKLAEILTPDELVVVDAIFFSHHTLREAGEILAVTRRNVNKAFGRSYMVKIRDDALAKLRAACADGSFDGLLDLG